MDLLKRVGCLLLTCIWDATTCQLGCPGAGTGSQQTLLNWLPWTAQLTSSTACRKPVEMDLLLNVHLNSVSPSLLAKTTVGATSGPFH